MSDFTYDIDDLQTTTANGRRNSVRFLVGDTDSTDVQISDDEILFALAQNGDNIYAAGAFCCRALAAKYARRVDTELDGALSASYSDMHKHYIAMSENLDAEYRKSSGLGIKAGGMTISSIDNVRSDDDRVSPSFRRDRFRNPPNYEGSTDYE